MMVAKRTTVLALAVWGIAATFGVAAPQVSQYLGPCALVAASDGKVLYVANADRRQIAWVELPGGNITRRVDLPAEPTGLVITADGSRLIVACAAPKSTVVVLDAVSGKLIEKIPAGHTAVGPALSPDGRILYVCNRMDNDISVIDLAAGRELTRVKAVREPVAAAVTPDGKTVLVANHLPNTRTDMYFAGNIAAVLTVIDTRTNQTTSIELHRGSHSLRGLCLSPDGKYAYVTHLLCNFELIPSQVDIGWIHSNVVTIIDTSEKKLINTVALDEMFAGAGNPWGVGCSADGKTLCVGHAGSHEISVVDAPAALGMLNQIFTSPSVGAIAEDSRAGTHPPRRIKLPGKGPRGLAVVGTKVYVAEYFSDTLAVVDLNASADEPSGTIALGPKPKLSIQRRGELLFNDATICYENWQSCASCHPDGRTDALNWDLLNDGAGNPKSTKSVILAFETPPAMSEGVRPTAEAAVRAGIEHILFAMRPEEEAAAIDEYLRSLKPVPSPHLVDGHLSPAAQRGKQLFHSNRVGCYKCHPAPLYTDLKFHDVGTGSSYTSERFDTPTLVEVWRTAPYLHDGRYLTIKELLVKGKHGKSRGRVEDLSEKEIDDLTEFVLSL
jgi:YVTN family beta-propeller protein